MGMNIHETKIKTFLHFSIKWCEFFVKNLKLKTFTYHIYI
jgi:hypothetical protein